ncbi:A24 family peptidase [Candidatus Phyllobacterium onerii]|jgi:prepilin peptidase CpaA|uniref:A24 family peptidase n=1 Tax=Candidatus Phyllobacterium onerii TaxID=3020828 RepID=UPI00232AA436|nr:prepilin peptidase [Phyllobacterium sp. IY22]
MVEAAILVIFPFAMVFAATSDLLSMTIQNRVPLILIGSFIVLAPLTGMAWDVYGMHFVAAVTVLAATFALFATGTMGGGDAKLMAATSLWLGWNLELVQYLVTLSLFGGMLTMLILHYRGSFVARVYTERFEFMRRLAQKGEGVPYGIALGLAGLLAFPSSPLGVWVIDRLAHS